VEIVRFHTSFRVEKYIIIGFLLVILAGAFLLWLSNNCLYHMPLGMIDALFISASGVCVTGLSTVDISSQFGFLSQVILLALIQIGGLGVMTAMMLIPIATGRRIGLKGRIFFLGELGVDGVEGAVRLFYTVIKFTLFFEGLGAVLLFPGFLSCGETATKSLYYAVFHAVSAFCNAGFSPCAGGLHNYCMTLIVPGTIMLLIVLGGIGFPVFAECADCVKNKKRLSVYPKLVLVVTFSLIFGGALIILFSDWDTAFKDMPIWAKAWNAMFASVTTRTAGFDTVSPALFSGLGQFLMIILMFVGASPASTGGGVKTTTLGVIAVSVWNELHSKQHTSVLKRELTQRTERRAVSIVSLFIITIFVSSILLTITESKSFVSLLFEITSALGTVGLSLGITSDLSNTGKLLITLLMFWGRVGLYSFISVIVSADDSRTNIRYPSTYIPLG
jgi:trk system potassium uptake protein TrkH